LRRDAKPCTLWRPTGLSTDFNQEDRYLPHATGLGPVEDAGFVDSHFAATRLSWEVANALPEELQRGAAAWDQYNQCLAALLHAANSSGRLNPTQGLLIREGDKLVTIPVIHRGFAWSAEDFQRLYPPPTSREPLLHRWYCCAGIGVPLVVERWRIDDCPVEARFYPEKSSFAATALLRFDAAGAAVLEFHNPLNSQRLNAANDPAPLAADFTAPLAWAIDQTPRTYLTGFLHPGRPETSARLMFLEPYQACKIPVVIIHGLYSDPQSCADLINDLHSTPGFVQKFQIWAYRYPTGEGILRSAATLRDELNAAVAELDPDGTDPAIRRMVLIGHSMGGLIAKLQVTHAQEQLWARVANRPLEEIVASDKTRAELARLCFFDPSPNVARVIFIATPHCGALPSSELLGKGASHLVEPPADELAMHQQLMADNPGTFDPRIERRFPTSVDMLAPDSPLLEVMHHMPIGAGVQLHNIIGVSHPVSCDGPSDGIVSIYSALHPGCQSLLAVGARHAEVQRSLETSAEVLRILDEHCRTAPTNSK